MMYIIGILISLLFNFSFELEGQTITFVIISQNNNYNNKLGKELENSLREQSHQLQLDTPQILISHKHFTMTADWTLSPLIVPVLNAIEKNTQWVIFLEDRASVTVKLLLEGLRKYDPDKEIWLGHALHDSDATIIHHFAFHDDPTFFKFPNLGSGIVFSVPLLKRLKSRIQKGFKQLDFHIDPAHEFALFVYDDGKGAMIQHDYCFCSKQGPNCAIYPKKIESCGEPDVSSLYFAIKTCRQFHNDRVEVVKKTWYKYTAKKTFFSDFEDPNIPTKSLGIPNTKQGHCQKTMNILQYGSKEFDNDTKLQWLALVDDDTILSVSRMATLTTCHWNTSQLILGERYRFGAQGFNYPTGGAGILINRAALKLLAHVCNCPRPDAPDDMVLGACAEENGVVLVHVPQMHQARPQDYAQGRLATNDAVSFHKHWMTDPTETYNHWFLMDDQKIDRSYKKSEL